MAEPGLGEGASDARRWLGNRPRLRTRGAAGIGVITALPVKRPNCLLDFGPAATDCGLLIGNPLEHNRDIVPLNQRCTLRIDHPWRLSPPVRLVTLANTGPGEDARLRLCSAGCAQAFGPALDLLLAKRPLPMGAPGEVADDRRTGHIASGQGNQ